MAELLFTLYLLSGIAKVFLKFFLGDTFADLFNPTLIFAALLVLLSAFQGLKNIYIKNKLYIARGSLPVTTFLLAFYAWMIFSLLYSVSPQYSGIKTFLFLTNLVAFLFPLTFKGFDFQRWVKYFVYTGSVFIVLYLALVPRSYMAYMSENVEISGKYLDIGYLAALNVLLLILLMPHLEMKRWLKLGFIGVNLAAVVITGARGPQVFMILALLVYVFGNPKIIYRFVGHLDFKKFLIIGISVMILAVGLYKILSNYMDNIERNLQRLSLVMDVESSSLAVRVDQIYFAIEKIFENAVNFLFGNGIGSFGILYAGEDVRLYPHNIILETWFEMGVTGVIILLLFFLFYIKKIKLNSPSFYIFFYLLLNSLKSSSLVDLRIMFGIFACLVVFANHLKYREYGNENEVDA
ncbi:MAG TPA: O-antigen ligase family protein [Candidatus Kapabacteria bacterium]|nr:O-antigen ligase family protein [Candidatus Kapabacteria bacterium]